MTEEVKKTQLEICKKYSAEFHSIDDDAKVGISENTDGIAMPINGLRHKPTAGTSGWYIWSGEEPSSDEDFFKPVHAKHLESSLPQVLKYLALPPGYRFLIADDYVDVWFDAELLKV